MLSTKQVGLNFFKGVDTSTFLRRLRLLESKNYLKRIIGLESHELLWTLAEKGTGIAKVSLPKRRWSKNMLEHDYKLLCLRLILEGAGISESWTPELQIRSSIFEKYGLRGIKQRLVPDGLMSVEVNGKMESVAIEMELTLKSKRRYRNLFNHYKQRLQAKLYGVNSQIEGLAERIAILPRTITPVPLFKQMEKIGPLKRILRKGF
jgi:hypothetical protein